MLRTALPFLLVLCGSALAGDLTGDYAGTYTSSEGVEGKIHLALKKNADTTWACVFSFSTEDCEVTAKTVSCAVDDNKLSAEYEADVQGTTLVVTTEATSSAGALDGTYKVKSSSGEPVGEGKWKASQKT